MRGMNHCADREGSRATPGVFAHIGWPTLRALDRGERPPAGEIGKEGTVYRP
jgi:hypothetical protein